MASAPRNESTLPMVSVIVCTFNRRYALENCLNSLFGIDYPKFEALVVDGGSTDGTKELVKEKFRKAKFIFEKRRGVSHARNTGVKQAQGSIVAFIDDDCIPDKGWLTNLVSCYIGNEIGGVGGRALPILKVKVPDQYRHYLELLGAYDRGNERKEVNWITGCSMSFRKAVFKKVGFFNPLLGRRGARLTGNEEVEFCWRVRSRGYKIIYEPKAVVYHEIPTQRFSLTYSTRRSFYQGVSDFYYHTFKKKRRSISRVLRALIRNGLKLICKRKPSLLIEICYDVGYLREIILNKS